MKVPSVTSVTRNVWGEDIKPILPLNINTSDIIQGWRNNILFRQLNLYICLECKKPFFIFKFWCQKDVRCPYCQAKASYIIQKKSFLAKFCKRMLPYLKVEVARKKVANLLERTKSFKEEQEKARKKIEEMNSNTAAGS